MALADFSHPAPPGFPAVPSRVLGGSATPTGSPGSTYALYIKSNGSLYYWDGSVWHLITSGSSGTVQVVTGAFANPNSNVTPADTASAAIYYQQGGAPNVWRWDVTDQVWYQTIG